MKTTINLIIIATLFAMFGCKSNPEDLRKLTAHEWQLKEMKTGTEKIELPARVPNVSFTDTNTMYGFSGCNRFFGKFTAKGHTLTISPAGSTKMACPNMKFEDQFMKTLAGMTTYSVTDNELTLTSKDKKETLVFTAKNKNKPVGVADDDHGCNSAAGYIWSEALQDCIRLSESAIRLESVEDPDAATSAFIIFAADSAQVEVFIPNQKNHPLLHKRTLPTNISVWNVEDDDTYNVRRLNGKWVIEQRAEQLYVEE